MREALGQTFQCFLRRASSRWETATGRSQGTGRTLKGAPLILVIPKDRVVAKGQITFGELVQQHAKRPPIGSLGIRRRRSLGLTLGKAPRLVAAKGDLWRHVERGARALGGRGQGLGAEQSEAEVATQERTRDVSKEGRMLWA